MTEDQLRKELLDDFDVQAETSLTKDELINMLCSEFEAFQRLLDTTMLPPLPAESKEQHQTNRDQEKQKYQDIPRRERGELGGAGAVLVPARAPEQGNPQDSGRNVTRNANGKKHNKRRPRFQSQDLKMLRFFERQRKKSEDQKNEDDVNRARTRDWRGVIEEVHDEQPPRSEAHSSPIAALHQTRLVSQTPQRTEAEKQEAKQNRGIEWSAGSQPSQSRRGADTALYRSRPQSFGDGEVARPSIDDSGRGANLKTAVTPAGPFVQTPNGSPIPVDERKSEDDDTFYDVSDISDDDEK
jgi:hypothetical protein